MLDGAHNAAGIEALVHSLKKVWPGKRVRVLFAIMRDKDHESVLTALHENCAEVIWLPLWEHFPRALNPQENGVTGPFPALTWDGLRPWLLPDSGADAVVVCGSLYLLGEVIPLLLEAYPGLEPFRDLALDPKA